MLKEVIIQENIFGEGEIIYTDYTGKKQQITRNNNLGIEAQLFFIEKKSAYEAVKHLIERVENVKKFGHGYYINEHKIMVLGQVKQIVEHIKTKDTYQTLANFILFNINKIRDIMPPSRSLHFEGSLKIVKHLEDLSNYKDREKEIQKIFNQKRLSVG